MALAFATAGSRVEAGDAGPDVARLRSALLAAPREAQADLVVPYVERAQLDAAPDLSLLMGEVSGSADRDDARLYDTLCREVGRLGGNWAAEAFHEVAASPEASDDQKRGAIVCLGCIGLPAVPSLRVLAEDDPTSGLAASTLARLFDSHLGLFEPMEVALRKAIASRRARPRGQDCDASSSAIAGFLALFRGMGRAPASELVAEALKDPCEWVRAGALSVIQSQAKSRCDARDVVEQMTARDPSEAVRRAAKTALASEACAQ